MTHHQKLICHGEMITDSASLEDLRFAGFSRYHPHSKFTSAHSYLQALAATRHDEIAAPQRSCRPLRQ